MKSEEKQDIAEFLTRGMSDFDCYMAFAPRRGNDSDVFGRKEAIARIASTWSGAKLRARRDALLKSNSRGELEIFVTMTVDGGYGTQFQAYSWYHAEEQAKAAGYKILDWTEMEHRKILVIQQ